MKKLFLVLSFMAVSTTYAENPVMLIVQMPDGSQIHIPVPQTDEATPRPPKPIELPDDK